MMVETLAEDYFLRAWAARVRAGLGVTRDDPDFSTHLIRIGGAICGDKAGLDEVVASKAAGWALASASPEITTVEPPVIDLVADLQVEGSPETMPGLLQNGGCFVRTKGGRSLVELEEDERNPGGSVRAISLHRALGAWYVSTFEQLKNGLDYVFGYRCQLEWGAPSIDEALVEDRYSGAFRGLEHLSEAQRQRLLPTELDRARVLPAVRWLLSFAVLLDARGAPLEHSDGAAAERVLRSGRYRAARGMRYRTLRLSARGVRTRELISEPPREETTAPRPNLEKRDRPIAGFLRRQPCGPGRKDRRWIFVEPFTAARWVRSDAPDDMPRKTSVRRAPEEK